MCSIQSLDWAGVVCQCWLTLACVQKRSEQNPKNANVGNRIVFAALDHLLKLPVDIYLLLNIVAVLAKLQLVSSLPSKMSVVWVQTVWSEGHVLPDQVMHGCSD